MFKYIPVEQQTLEARKENARLKAENEKMKSDIDYIAMRSDIDLEDEGEEASDNG